MTELVDIGANLTNKSFRADLPQVLARADAAGVSAIVITGTNVQASADALALAAEPSPVSLFSTAGVHPHHASTYGPQAEEALREQLGSPIVVAAGECGLDFNRNYSPRADQIAAFEAQLALAATAGKPLFLHERDAHDTFLAILREHRPHLSDAVVHCFTGSRAALERYLELDLHIGITGWVTDVRRGRELFDLVRSIPASHLMIETDAPYLLPHGATPHVPRRNEPALLPHVLRAIARSRGEDPTVLARRTTETARRFFRLDAERHAAPR